jgi:hypothetical protein
MPGMPTTIRRNGLIILALLFSVGFLTFLASSIQRGVFFSSDGGMKYLMVKQISEGKGFKYLHTDQPAWVQSIWNEGFFPFGPPFIYPSASGFLFSFPPAFPWISAFSFHYLGYTGLYLLPFLSTIGLWISLVYVLKRYHLENGKIALTLLVLVFCSPLTIYGASFWEHTTAEWFLFIGAIGILGPPKNRGLAVAAGFVSGLAVWLRPEALMMNMLYLVALIACFIKQRNGSLLLLLVGIGLPTLAFFFFNKIEWGAFFGVHGYQVLDRPALSTAWANGVSNLWHINLRALRFFPILLFLFPLAYWTRKDQSGPDRYRLNLLLVVLALYCLLTPFILPNQGGRQWGARYFLPVIPAGLLAVARLQMQWRYKNQPDWQRMGMVAASVLIIGYSFYLNTVKGGIRTLRQENYHRVKPSLDFIANRNTKTIVINAGYIAMELSYDFGERFFFLADNDQKLAALLDQLKASGIHEFIYIYDVNRDKGLPQILQKPGKPEMATGNFACSKFSIP